MQRYHMRLAEREVRSKSEMMRVISHARHMTVALSKDDVPYLVSLNYSFDKKRKCFYFHAAKAGRKLEYVRSNPRVWGQVMEDLGYIDGKCDYGYRTVMFGGKAKIVADPEEKRRALSMMIDRYESDPGAAKKRLLVAGKLERVCICRIDVTQMTGKKSLPPKD